MVELKDKLDANIPSEVVETREAWRGGPRLSYLSGAYVIKRMNDVIGHGNWSYKIVSLTKVFEGTVEQSGGEVYATSYIATIELSVDGYTKFIDVGYGDGTDKKNPGKAHELAVKEAVTDGVKRTAKNLGISFGLGLYFKSGEYVNETNEPKPTERKEAKKDDTAKPVKAPAKILRDKIKNSFAVLQAQKKITKDTFIKDYLAGAKTDDLSEESANKVLEQIKANFPELGL